MSVVTERVPSYVHLERGLPNFHWICRQHPLHATQTSLSLISRIQQSEYWTHERLRWERTQPSTHGVPECSTVGADVGKTSSCMEITAWRNLSFSLILIRIAGLEAVHSRKASTYKTLTIRCHEHIRYIKNNQPKSAYAQHILHNIHEYGTPTETITLLKPVKPDTMLIPYEQLFIQAYHQTGNIVPEQNSNETNPLFQLIIRLSQTSTCSNGITHQTVSK
jgi:hypothetical protein